VLVARVEMPQRAVLERRRILPRKELIDDGRRSLSLAGRRIGRERARSREENDQTEWIKERLMIVMESARIVTAARDERDERAMDEPPRRGV
jgi:hypothetical protein